jgi:hypothetical protein
MKKLQEDREELLKNKKDPEFEDEDEREEYEARKKQ